MALSDAVRVAKKVPLADVSKLGETVALAEPLNVCVAITLPDASDADGTVIGSVLKSERPIVRSGTLATPVGELDTTESDGTVRVSWEFTT